MVYITDDARRLLESNMFFIDNPELYFIIDAFKARSAPKHLWDCELNDLIPVFIDDNKTFTVDISYASNLINEEEQILSKEIQKLEQELIKLDKTKLNSSDLSRVLSRAKEDTFREYRQDINRSVDQTVKHDFYLSRLAYWESYYKGILKENKNMTISLLKMKKDSLSSSYITIVNPYSLTIYLKNDTTFFKTFNKLDDCLSFIKMAKCCDLMDILNKLNRRDF